MKRRDFLKTAAVGAAAPVLSRFVWANAAQRRILYFDRSTEYVHPPTVVQEDGTTICGNALAALGQEDGFAVDSTKDPSVFDGDLSKYSAFVFYTCGNLDAPKDGQPGMSQQGILNFYSAIRGGVGLLGIHSATDTWKTPGPLWENQPFNDRKGYTNLIGAQFVLHGNQQETKLRIIEKGFPFLGSQGDELTCFDEWYTLKNFNPDLHVVLLQETAGMDDSGDGCYNRPPYPSTWIRREGKGKVAYTSLGHNNSSFWEPKMKGIVSDLIKFTTGQIEVDTTPNIDSVCPDCTILRRA